jgi:hypothetical protein
MKREDNLKPIDIDSIIHSFDDICTTCNNAEVCLLQKNKIRPVWFCEQFDDYMPIVENKNVAVKSPITKSDMRSTQSTKDSREFKGLCVNCECRFDCKLCKPNGGVWHCEEYR